MGPQAGEIPCAQTAGG